MEGVHTAGKKTGVTAYISPRYKRAVVNYVAISERILSVSLLTKQGLLTIINHHAPDETTAQKDKDAHWETMHHTVAEAPNSGMKLVIGDTIIRWHGRSSIEHDILGPYLFGRGLAYLHKHNHNNRDLGAEFLRAHDMNFFSFYVVALSL